MCKLSTLLKQFFPALSDYQLGNLTHSSAATRVTRKTKS
uniref:Uncharacterized protein n=1 Tax=Anguilla anguilla TaxID=7936 RepID=A0A0E9WCB5_ANGAN